MQKRKLIINADDFGLAESVNEGILHAFENGVLTSTSIMACGKAFDHAIQIAKTAGLKNIGIHLVLDEERPVSNPSTIPSLINKENFFLSRNKLLTRLLFLKNISLKEVEMEFRAQLKRCQDADLELTHIDGHGHVHVYPGISKIVIKLAKEFGIKKVRIPYEPFSVVGDRFRPKRYMEKSLVSFFSLFAAKQYKKNHLLSPRHFLGLCYGGRLSESLLEDLFDRLPEQGTVEIMTHPGRHNENELEPYKKWNYHWEEELKALTKWQKSDIEKAQALQLISFRDLIEE